MLDNTETPENTENAAVESSAPAKKVARKAPAKRAPRKAVQATEAATDTAPGQSETPDATPKKASRPRKTTAKKAATEVAPEAAPDGAEATPEPAKKTPRKRATKAAAAPATEAVPADEVTVAAPAPAPAAAPALAAPAVLFQPPSEVTPPTRRRKTTAKPALAEPAIEQAELTATEPVDEPADLDEDLAEGTEPSDGTGRRRRRRGRRGRGSRPEDATVDADAEGLEAEEADEADEVEAETDHADEVAEAALSASARRRRRRRRSTGADGVEGAEDDPPNTVVHVRDGRLAGARGSAADEDGVRGVKGSTRLEAKRQRRKDNRDTGRRRAPILTEAEFLARRESVERVMAVRQTGDRTQIAVLEDGILVEHYVTRASAASAVGNVYLGRVQNVLPSMEAAFIDIGRGRNGVLYAGEVNWDAAGLEGKARSIEGAMSSGDSVLVQVTKDPIGHKGARLTSQISLPGRFLVYVPGGGMTGISRKLPDVERTRLKAILKKVVPDDAGVIVRTAAEGASEADLISDVERLKAQWDGIQSKAAEPGNAPTLVYGEPDLAIRVVRDVFNDDFTKLTVAGSDIHRTVADYVSEVAPDLEERISLHTAETDLFRDLRVDEQLAKALDRKVWLPSGGSLVIDRTEAMTVVDVNTGKYTGSGGNLEQTVTRNNLEAAEEIVRQLRLRDIGGIIVIDFIDMVLESNRDLVLRRLTECLGRDRTKHQVAEVTSLGLVQMTRKRVGEGLLEAFSEQCSVCNGRGVIIHTEPVDKKPAGGAGEQTSEDDRPARGKRTRKANAPQTTPQPDAAAVALADEQRRAAANAIAAIAKATHHDEQAEPVEAADVLEVPESLREAPLVAAVQTPEPAAQIAAAAAPRPRRRRAASRPAGPPAGVAAEAAADPAAASG
jgi:ribonuclease E